MASNILKKGRGTPYPDFAEDIDLAQFIGIPAWEIEHIPWAWYQKYQIYGAAMAEADRRGRK